MAEYKTPGVYIEEIVKLPPSIASVETAIPAFIGYTEKAQWKEPDDLRLKPKRIESLLEYERFFGLANKEAQDSVEIIFDSTSGRLEISGKANEELRSRFLMYYSLQMFFENGGGPCWIVSVGNYTDTGGVVLDANLKNGLTEVEAINEVTLLLFPDAINLPGPESYYGLHMAALNQCKELKDRFTVFDIFHNPANADQWQEDITFFRDNFAGEPDELKYGAVYFPRIYTGIDFRIEDASVKVTSKQSGELGATLAELNGNNNSLYFLGKAALSNMQMLLPASSAMVGVYADVDNTRGVWKAPANVNINNVFAPQYLITNKQQESLNVDVKAGKSINVVRKFEGRGPAIVWGARTLAGNDNEWRYISVRRFFNMVEESTKNATEQFVFEPNDRNTWVRVKSMIENYLTQQWKAGALMGTTTREAFFVKVGLGETMSELDILEGRMIVEIGMAVVRPAEFIILKFMHKMLQES